MPKNENIDAFWDIEDLIPQPQKKAILNRECSETTATEITLDTPHMHEGAKVPPRVTEERKKEMSRILREYQREGLISSVKILSWPTTFEFYTKFCKDAVRYFSLAHEPCEYVYFFSYMPQYEQMTVSQMAYYLYWRDEVRKGNYLKTDINYLFLYVYEIINLTDQIPPKAGAVALSRLWRAYRDEFRYLDKYLGEWLCDYCLIHNVSPDWAALGAFAGEIASKVSLPEFYLKDGRILWNVIETLSSYDYRKSKYYEAHEKEYDFHIPRAMERAVNRVIMNNLHDFGISSAVTCRDSYAGAIVSHKSKFKMEITRYALRKTNGVGDGLKHIFANLIKLAENQLRGAFGIKSRFSPVIEDVRLKQEILDYFREYLPTKAEKTKKQALCEEAYMALYEPKQTGTADISRALNIEKEAWATADLLSVEDDTEEILPAVPMCAVMATGNADVPALTDFFETAPMKPEMAVSTFSSEDEFGFIREMLNDLQKNALKAALDGAFASYCSGIGVMAEHLRGEINEISMEYIGDMILDGDFSVLEDYEAEISAALHSL